MRFRHAEQTGRPAGFPHRGSSYPATVFSATVFSATAFAIIRALQTSYTFCAPHHRPPNGPTAMAFSIPDDGAGMPAAFRYQWLFQRMRVGRETLRAQRALAMTRTRYPEGEMRAATEAALDPGPDEELPAYRIEWTHPFVIWAN